MHVLADEVRIKILRDLKYQSRLNSKSENPNEATLPQMGET